MKHTVIFRGSQPVASVHSDEPDHDAQVSRAVDAAHRQNDAEGSAAEVKTEVQEFDDESGKAVKSNGSTKKGK
jgi:hypothetical protein